MGGRGTHSIERLCALVPFLCAIGLLFVGCQASVDPSAVTPGMQETPNDRPSSESNTVEEDDALTPGDGGQGGSEDADEPGSEGLPAERPNDGGQELTDLPTEEEPPTVAGDVSGDGVVNEDDFDIYLDSLNLQEGDPGFRPDLDLNEDGVISLVDYQMWYSIAFDEVPEE